MVGILRFSILCFLLFSIFQMKNFVDAANDGTGLKDEQRITEGPKMWLGREGWRSAKNIFKALGFVNYVNMKIGKNSKNGHNEKELVIGVENPKFWSNLCSKPDEFRTKIGTAINYVFDDILEERRKEILEKIIEDKNKLIRENGLENFSKKLAENLYDWYFSLKGPDVIGYPITNEAYMKAKAELVTKPIEGMWTTGLAYERVNSIKREYNTMDNVEKSNVKIELYDVGTGDGELSAEIYKNLHQNGFNNLEMALIDIDDGIEWNHADSECANIQNKEKEIKNGHLRRLLYNGRDLGLKILEDLKHKKAKENVAEIKSKMMNELIIVTFNHSLHHWPSLESQEESIRQLGEVLPIGSIVILKEHYNLVNDDQISLNHLFIHFRNNLFHYLPDAEKGNPKKCRRDRESTNRLMDEYVKESGAHNYLSPFILDDIMTKNGFELYSFTDEKPDDPNRTVVYAFIKKKHNGKMANKNQINPIDEKGATAGEGNNRKRKGKEPLEQKDSTKKARKNVAAIDETDAHLTMKKLTDKNFLKND